MTDGWHLRYPSAVEKSCATSWPAAMTKAEIAIAKAAVATLASLTILLQSDEFEREVLKLLFLRAQVRESAAVKSRGRRGDQLEGLL